MSDYATRVRTLDILTGDIAMTSRDYLRQNRRLVIIGREQTRLFVMRSDGKSAAITPEEFALNRRRYVHPRSMQPDRSAEL